MRLNLCGVALWKGMVIFMAKKTSYGNNDIVALKGPDQVRKRPAVIFGSDGLEGCQHSVFEILSNSIDEAREGFGDKIVITRFLDKSVEIQDFGRGIPVDYNEKEKNYNWFLVFCTLYAGGKYNTNNGGSYEYSLGLNGLGLCATQFASEYMEAEIHRDGWCYKLNFKKGVAVGEMEKEKYTKRDTGDRDDLNDYKVLINSALCFSNKNQLKEYYHNSSWLEHGGAPEKAVRNAFTYQLDAYLKANGKYVKSDPKIKFEDIEDCMILVVSSFSTQTSYENQTKKAITNKFIQEAMTDFFKHQLEIYFIENRAEAEKIANQVLVNMRSRVKAETTRQSLKKTLSTSNDLANRVQKFVDCRTKDAGERELFIVEGDSALGACKQARNSEFQALMPVRGKILNCLKVEYDRIFKSEIITDLIKVLGCGVEVKSKAMKGLAQFNLDMLRYNKIIICTDADVDGFQIRTLILTMIYRLMPTLIEEGKVFIAETPLYEINTKDQVWFAYTEKEKTQALEEIGNQKYTIQRSKGLGENEADMMWMTTMNPETRRLVEILPEDAERTAQIFDMLLGDNLAGRKEHIADNGHLYIDMLDLS